MTFLSGWPFWQRFVLSLTTGAVAAFGLPPMGLWVATLAALMLVPAIAGSARSRGECALLGWALGLGYFGHALVWIVEPFLVDAARHGWMAPFGLFFLAGGLALFWAAAFGLSMLAKGQRRRQIWFLIGTLSIAEVARGFLLTGFPWAGFAQIWVGTDVAQLLALVGPYGLGAATLAIALPPGHTLARGQGGGMLLIRSVPAMIFALFVIVWPNLRDPVEPGDQLVRLVQPNAAQHLKWHPDHAAEFFQRQLDYTAADPRPDLVVWPETSVPVWLDRARDAMEQVATASRGAPVVLGIQRSDYLGRIYNSMAVVGEGGTITDLYDKYHLVPFGEYVPFGDIMADYGITGFAANAGQGFSSGYGPDLIEVGSLGRALPLICYEAVFPQQLNAVSDRADMLLQITNDAWFGTQSGPYQHLAQARMRAIEQGLPMVRVANTGISAMIDPLGQVTASLPLGEAGYIDATLPRPFPQTLYAITGDLPVLLAIIALTLGVLRTRDPTEDQLVN
ncbi:apolipoprotein N-acyltransferase [Lutimaribacter marinistellae]|uniref:Apolipoprotein N-acyltransferase n=1 Tax=Lutimaribacter marinistellae TaxID=1820329 RepID=A0ABV7TFI4_9RHOB